MREKDPANIYHHKVQGHKPVPLHWAQLISLCYSITYIMVYLLSMTFFIRSFKSFMLAAISGKLKFQSRLQNMKHQLTCGGPAFFNQQAQEDSHLDLQHCWLVETDSATLQSRQIFHQSPFLMTSNVALKLWILPQMVRCQWYSISSVVIIGRTCLGIMELGNMQEAISGTQGPSLARRHLLWTSTRKPHVHRLIYMCSFWDTYYT